MGLLTETDELSTPEMGGMGRVFDGGYAEYTIVTEGETAAKPRTLDHLQASMIGVAGLTA